MCVKLCEPNCNSATAFSNSAQFLQAIVIAREPGLLTELLRKEGWLSCAGKCGLGDRHRMVEPCIESADPAIQRPGKADLPTPLVPP